MTDAQDATAGSEPSMEEILASIRRIIADEKAPDDGDATPPAQAPEESVLELTQAVQADGSVVDVTDDSADIEMAPLEAQPPAAETPAPTPPPAPEKKSPPKDDGLVSDDAALAASASLATLASKVDGERKVSMSSSLIGNGGRTLEDMVMELMKPMLKSWLDENLPPIVERIVQKEIERIARKTDL